MKVLLVVDAVVFTVACVFGWYVVAPLAVVAGAEALHVMRSQK